MITKINLTNYKAFDKAELKIKPITILLGANSVGKSSIIQFLLLLEQTVLAEQRNYKSALKLNGNYVNLGESTNLHRRHNLKIPIHFSFNLKNNLISNIIKTKLLGGLVLGGFAFLDFLFKNRHIDDSAFLYNQSIQFNKQNSEILQYRFAQLKHLNLVGIEFTKVISQISKLVANIEYNKLNDFYKSKYFSYNSIDIIVHPRTEIEILGMFDFLSKLSELEPTSYTLKYGVISSDGLLRTNSLQIKANSATIFEIKKNSNSKVDILSDFMNVENISKETLKNIGKLIDFNTTIFGSDINLRNLEASDFTSFIIKTIINAATNEVQEVFKPENVHYVSPLRFNPKRYYLLDKANANLSIDTFDGDSIAEVLKENKDLSLKVNKWFNKFGFDISVDNVEDIIHKLKVLQNDLSLDITDVGFGISQVLPVIIQGYLSKKDSLTIIEQPEIHLHPKMQAELADLFIEICSDLKEDEKVEKNKVVPAKYSIEKYLVIETHSEYLLKRLRRRIAEGRIKSDDVVIYSFEKSEDGNSSIMKEIDIAERGFFDWPIDFYGNELLEDNAKFMKYQKY